MKYLVRGAHLTAVLVAVATLVRCYYFDPYQSAWLPEPPDTMTVCSLTRSELISPEWWAMLQE